MADPQSTPTTHYGWAKPAVGASQDIWGADLNGNLDSQDTTLWSIQAAQSNYLPLAGGTLTGALNGTTATFQGSVRAGVGQAGAGNFSLTANGSAQFLNWATNNYIQYANSGGATSWFSGVGLQMTLDQSGNLVASGNITGGVVSANIGFMTRAGTGAGNGTYVFNHNWTGSVYQLWIGSVNAGNITVTSDYRAKKDVAALPSMWETVKALHPISFTYQDYTPAIELERDADAQPLIVGSDEEHWGFIAHELQQTLIPSAASGVKDQADCIQSPNPWTVIATLTKALQEAMERIEALEAKR